MIDITTIKRSLIMAVATVTALSTMAQINVSPEPGEVTELKEFVLTFDGSWALANRSAKFKVTGPEGVEIPAIQSGSLGTCYTVDFADEAVLTTPGEYVFTIPATKFEINGVENEEMSLHYTIVAPAQELMSISPAPGKVKKLDVFKLTFEGDWSLGTNRRSAITVSGPEGVEIPAVRSGSMGSYYEIYFEDDAEITAPGTYTLTIPEAKFAIDDIDQPEVSYVYTIESGSDQPYTPPYVITPAPGTYDMIDEGFILTINTEETVTANSRLIYLEGPDGDMSINVAVAEGKPQIAVTPIDAAGNPVALTALGSYSLIFAYNSVKIGGTGNEEPYVFVYNITGNGDEKWMGDYVTDPADESTVESLHSIKITFPDASSVQVSNNVNSETLPKLYDASTLDLISRGLVFAEANVLEVTLNNVVDQDGDYVLVVPADLITIDGQHPAFDIVAAYTVLHTTTADFEYTYTLDPEAGATIEAIAPIAITFASEEQIEVTNDIYAWGESAPHFTNDMGASNPNIQVKAGKDNTFTFIHEYAFDTEGTYTLVIPAGYFTLTDANGKSLKSQAIEAEYKVVYSKIEDIVKDESNIDVYNLKGVKILNSATLHDIKNLPAGIYVINGRKAIIK